MSVRADQLTATVEQLVCEATRDELRSAVARELADSLAAELAEHIASALMAGELSARLKRKLAQAGERGTQGDQAIGVALAGLLMDLARRAERHLDERARTWLTLAAEGRGRARERSDLARALSEPESASEPEGGTMDPATAPSAQGPAEGLPEPVRGPDCSRAADPAESPAERVSGTGGQGPTDSENGRDAGAQGGGAPIPLTSPPSPSTDARSPEVSP